MKRVFFFLGQEGGGGGRKEVMALDILLWIMS